jgi:diaminohydroxyphosphoribosylaminopyrimidine deaminase/5-amino-6-(5-phosphoribosylamino)uracil reductase
MAKQSPVRVVADSMLRLPVKSRLVQSAYETPVWALTGIAAPQEAEFHLLQLGVEVLRSPESARRLDLKNGLEFLAAKGITRLMVEGGPTLAAGFVAADLVDEAVLFHSPKIIGPDGIDALAPGAMGALTAKLKQVTSDLVAADRQDIYLRG